MKQLFLKMSELEMFHVKQCEGRETRMAGKKKRKGKKAAHRSAGRVLARLLLTAVALLLAVMTVWGSFVTLECTDLPLRDLPSAFDGVKIVYISDIHLTTFNSLSKVKSLFKRLEKLKPDLLLLGGDYTGNDLVRLAENIGDDSAYDAAMTDLRDLFFLSLGAFEAPLGKFAVAGDMDNLLERSAGTPLDDAAALGGVTLLRDEAARVVKDGQTLILVGVDDWRTGLQDARTPAAGLAADDCVIVLSHTPEALPQLNGQIALGGGLWMDAALTGHTLGGQIRLGSHELFNPLSSDERYLSGWHMENSTKTLISTGLSGATFTFRLGSTAQVHLITLRVQSAVETPALSWPAVPKGD